MKKVLKTYLILSGVLISAMSMAATGSTAKSAKSSKPVAKAPVKSASTSKKVQSRAALERKMEIYEHAAANRELAGLTQVEHAREMEQEATELTKNSGVADMKEYKSLQKKAGTLEKSAAKLYGLASANFDKAATNRKMVANISKSLGKAEQYNSSQAYATNMKRQGDEAMQLAANACEAAAVAYDKADLPAEVAANSQMAAVWLEKLAIR